MDRNQVKNILMNMRNQENEAIINYYLGKLDMMDDKTLQEVLKQAGNSEDGIKKLMEEKISQRRNAGNEEKFKINEFFTYGISGSCIHFHLPGNLEEMFKQKGLSRTMDTINLSLLDAIKKAKDMKNDEYYQFQDIDSIYMISPILIRKELSFLSEMDFTTHLYKKAELANKTFLEEHPEAKLANHIFGPERNVGTARISFETLNSKEWEEKRKKKIEEFAKKGIVLEEKAHGEIK